MAGMTWSPDHKRGTLNLWHIVLHKMRGCAVAELLLTSEHPGIGLFSLLVLT